MYIYIYVYQHAPRGFRLRGLASRRGAAAQRPAEPFSASAQGGAELPQATQWPAPQRARPGVAVSLGAIGSELDPGFPLKETTGCLFVLVVTDGFGCVLGWFVGLWVCGLVCSF